MHTHTLKKLCKLSFRVPEERVEGRFNAEVIMSTESGRSW